MLKHYLVISGRNILRNKFYSIILVCGLSVGVAASLVNIGLLLCKDFARLVIISILIGCSLSAYIMYRWLQNFVYQAEINWWIYVLAGLFTLAIALFTVSWHIYKAVNRNPVETLRYE